MQMKAFTVALIACVAAAQLSPARPLAAQEVRGTVLGGATREPLRGAMVVLLGARDSAVATGLSGTGGTFRIRAPLAGQYRLRVEHIGFENSFSAPFELTDGASLEMNVEAATKAIELEGLVVTGARRNCEVRPTSGSVAVVWEEARKALAAAAWTAGRDVYRMIWTRYAREIAANGRKITSEQRQVTQARTLQPFGSPDLALLMERGFVQSQGSGSVYYGPDANVLLSNEFQSTHCFTVERRVDQGVAMLGLRFEPVRGRDLPEVAGVMWLEEAGARLRRVEFNYVNLSRELDVPDALGALEFRELPNGTWLIEEWRIRTPVLAAEQGVLGNRNIRVIRYNETGGLVNRVTNADGTLVSEGNPGRRVSGVVTDSAGAPASGARVFVDGVPLEAVTDASGAFQLPGLGDGIWTLGANSPALERLGFPGVTLDVEIGRTDVQNVRIALPSVTTVAARMCGTKKDPGNFYERAGHDARNSILVVRAVDQNGVPAIGAKLTIGWNRVFLDVGRDRQEIGSSREERVGALDDQGTFVLCNITADAKALFQLRATNSTRATPIVEAQLGERREVFVAELRLTEPLVAPPAAPVVEVAGVDVNVESRVRFLREAGFYQRQTLGAGVFVTPEIVERESFLKSREFLRGIQGVTVLEDFYSLIDPRYPCVRGWLKVEDRSGCERGPTAPRGPTILTRSSSGLVGPPCLPAIYMDHQQVQPSGDLGSVNEFELDTLPTSQILAIEVFRSAAEVPAEFNGGSAACGVILIWTKNGGGVK